jgi:hypothetical protein
MVSDNVGHASSILSSSLLQRCKGSMRWEIIVGCTRMGRRVAYTTILHYLMVSCNKLLTNGEREYKSDRTFHYFSSFYPVSFLFFYPSTYTSPKALDPMLHKLAPVTNHGWTIQWPIFSTWLNCWDANQGALGRVWIQ